MKKILLAAIGCLSLSACATVTRGSNDAWSVTSEPTGARVETTNGHFCAATPCAIRMKRKSEFTATVTKAGYKPATIAVTHKTSGAGAAGVAGNVLLGGIIGLGVDAATGASQDLTPNPATVTLEAMETAAQPAPAPAPAAAVAPAATPAPAATGATN
jgi:hypothetical protein